MNKAQEYRHIKRNSRYKIIGEALVQTDIPLIDMDKVIVYQGEDGKIWVRSNKEFFDGRFELIKK